MSRVRPAAGLNVTVIQARPLMTFTSTLDPGVVVTGQLHRFGYDAAEQAVVDLAVIHSISLPPGEYGGDGIERLVVDLDQLAGGFGLLGAFGDDQRNTFTDEAYAIARKHGALRLPVSFSQVQCLLQGGGSVLDGGRS